MTVFLTGGTGLLGSHVAERLRGRGVEVRALCRPEAETDFLRRKGCVIVRGELSDSLERHAVRMHGCTGVVHCAGAVYASGTISTVRAVNVEGTQRIFESAAMAGVLRGVHLSSVTVYGEVEGPRREEDVDPTKIPRKNSYALTKWEAEKVVEDMNGRGGLGVTILRPAAVFGERDRRILPSLVRLCRTGLVPLPGSGHNRLSVVYAGNVAEAVEKALKREGGEVFNLADDLGLTPRSFLNGLAGRMGVRLRFAPLPISWVRGVARMGDKLGLGIPGVSGLSLSRAASLILDENPYVSEKARAVLGWSPPHSVEDTMDRVGSWLKERGMI